MSDVTRTTGLVMRLRELYNNAVQGEWEWDDPEPDEFEGTYRIFVKTRFGSESIMSDRQYYPTAPDKETAAYLFAAHWALPALLNELERLQKLEADE